MTFSKMTTLATAITFLSLVSVANAEEQKAAQENRDPKIQELVAKLDKFTKCQDTDPAGVKKACTEFCTAEGAIWGEGNCSKQEYWDKCRSKCQSKDIQDCIKTANKNNLTGTPDCN